MKIKTTVTIKTLVTTTPTIAPTMADGNDESLGPTYTSSPTVTGDSVPTWTCMWKMGAFGHCCHRHTYFLHPNYLMPTLT